MEIKLWQQFSRSRMDLIVTIITVLVIFVLLHQFDTFEELHELTREYEEFELDEIILLIFALPFPMMWYAFRRTKEVRDVAKQRVKLEQSLAHTRKIETLGALSGGVAHEINNQLLPVTTMAELVLDKMPTSHPDRKKMELVISGATAAKNTVANILQFTRQTESKATSCTLNSTCREAVALMEISCPTNIKLSIDIGESTAQVELSRDEVHSIVMNLFSNAVDACCNGSGQIKLVVSTENLSTSLENSELLPGNYARIDVQDTGIGISSQDQQQIYVPFYSTKLGDDGTGLGLSIVYQLARKAGGTVLLESEVGAGANFTVFLPIIDS